jgi:hypothetical protein
MKKLHVALIVVAALPLAAIVGCQAGVSYPFPEFETVDDPPANGAVDPAPSVATPSPTSTQIDNPNKNQQGTPATTNTATGVSGGSTVKDGG